VTTAADYDREFAKYMAGDSISMNIVREGKPMQLSVYLEGQPTAYHVSYEYPGGRSARSDGFRNVLVHDAAIKATECGSPVFDSEGNFYGVNIARRSRTSTLLMPVATLSQFLKTLTNSK
jgi:serine protease Do